MTEQTRQEIISLDYGQTVIIYPTRLSAEDVNDLEEAVRLLIVRLRRRALHEASGETEGERHGR